MDDDFGDYDRDEIVDLDIDPVLPSATDRRMTSPNLRVRGAPGRPVVA